MFPIVPVTLWVMKQRSNEEVGEMVKARRLELRMAPNEVTAAARVDPKTYASLEDGTRWPQERSRLRIETALWWQPGTIAALAKGDYPTILPDVRNFDDDVARLQSVRRAAQAASDEEAQMRAENELANVYSTRGRFEHAQYEARQSGHLNVMVDLSFLADEVDSAASLSTPSSDAGEDEIADFISEVETLISVVEDLTDAVHDLVLDGFDGDLALLRQMKRDVRKRNLATKGMQEQDDNIASADSDEERPNPLDGTDDFAADDDNGDGEAREAT